MDSISLVFDKDKLIDFDAGLRYATKYMGNLKHLEIDLQAIDKNDTYKLSAKKLSSLLRSKKGALESIGVSWPSRDSVDVPDVCGVVWKELHGLKQLYLCFVQFDDAQCLHDIIYQQSNTILALELVYLEIDWAKSRRTIAQAVNSCKCLVKLRLVGCGLTNSDLKIMLQDLPDLRILNLSQGIDTNSYGFTDNTCGLMAQVPRPSGAHSRQPQPAFSQRDSQGI